eukprot:5830998-Pyramimonas_sp.AAC.1
MEGVEANAEAGGSGAKKGAESEGAKPRTDKRKREDDAKPAAVGPGSFPFLSNRGFDLRTRHSAETSL